jgi:PAS domain S-box-containing protein
VRLAVSEREARSVIVDQAAIWGLVESAPDAVVAVDDDGRIVWVNAQTERLFGYPRQELLGEPVELLVPEQARADHPAQRARYVADPVPRPMEARGGLAGRRKDGSLFPAEISLNAVHTQQGLLIWARVRDVGVRRRAEVALREHQATLQAMVNASPDIIALLDSQGRVQLMSPAVERILGYAPSQRLGEDIFHSPILHPDDREPFTQALRRVIDGQEEQTAVRVRTRHVDGHWVVLEAYIRRLEDGSGVLLIMVRDVTGQAALEADLRHDKLEAEQASQIKSEYLSRMSHELRTPLNAILGFAQLLELDQLNQEQRDCVRQIHQGAEHLLALINEVLDIAAIEADRLPLSLEPVSVAAVLGEAVELLRPLADQHGILLLPGPSGGCAAHVQADRQRLTQILLNLLSNAVKYNHPGGSVVLDCAPVSGGRLRVSVSDTGPGIAPESFDSLFTPFERVGEQQAAQGTGLGLALSKRLAEAMGGMLGVSSVVGEGSTFWVELALAEAPAEPTQQQHARGWSDRDEGAAAGSALTVLCIEDSLPNLQLVERIVRRRPGAKLISAMRPQLGLDLAAQHHPDLVLLDLGLPDLSGEEVLRRLRAEPRTADVPVVVLSADARPAMISRLLDQGARAFLTKPLDVSELLGLLDAVTAERQPTAPPLPSP